ncbi:hypothetical protein GGI20_004713 [Coemansia sp. BCRC 34301]|nr:hypothetical protein GGI20_004713 [Coemansia sp. BCRC 34301]
MDLNTRLDQSLDQIIRENRNQRQAKSKSQAKAQVRVQPQAKPRNRAKAKVVVAKHVSDISSRLSTSGAAKPARRTKNTIRAVAPATNARTGIAARLGAAGSSKAVGNGKAVSGRVGKVARPEPGGRLAGLADKRRVEEQRKAKPAEKPNVKISIRGEAGPATVFISNLDSEASPDDVMTCFKQFGSIKNCTLLYDRTGKASGHAEVTYVSKQAAEEAAGKLNNALADGRRLSVQLVRGSSNSPAQPSTQSQSSGQAHGQQSQSSRGSSYSHRSGGGPWRKLRRAGGSQMDID